jgi:NitT/TauT family transport system permease protein
MRKLLRYLLTLAAILALWQLAAGEVLPPPLTALQAFAAALAGQAFWGHFAASARRVLAALVLSFALAFPLGLAMGAKPRLDAWLSPFVVLTYPIPKIVLLPVLLLLLGIGDSSKIGMIALILGYQILVTTRDGARAVHPRYVDSVASLGAGQWRILAEVYLPAALPHAFTAMRLGTGVAVAVLFFVESFATREGLGYLIMDAWGSFDYPRMFTGIIGMSALGVLLYELANVLERHFCRWRSRTARTRTS